MARILRGDVRRADLDPTRGSGRAGLRPVRALKERLGRRIARASETEMLKVIAGLSEKFGAE